MSAVPPDYLFNDFSFREWLEEEDNWLYYDLATGRDFGLFENLGDNIYEGHQVFGTHRGRAGIEFGRKVLSYFFEANPQALVIGATPLENKPARWMARQLGFQSWGTSDNFERFFLTLRPERGII